MHAFDTIVAAVADNPRNAHFFLQGAGGNGKTFLYIALCHYFRAQGKIVLCVASSGIAAELPPGERTSHSRIQIPLQVHENSTTMITGTSDAADLMRRAVLSGMKCQCSIKITLKLCIALCVIFVKIPTRCLADCLAVLGRGFTKGIKHNPPWDCRQRFTPRPMNRQNARIAPWSSTFERI